MAKSFTPLLTDSGLSNLKALKLTVIGPAWVTCLVLNQSLARVFVGIGLT